MGEANKAGNIEWVVESGHYSSMTCHIGNIAYQKKARIPWQKEWDL
jgi:hypothetical protein